MSVHTTNLRFNTEKETQRRAWEFLQGMDKQRFKSYSQVISTALVEYFERETKLRDDPFLETWEREERFVERIVAAVESALTKALPVFLAGCAAGLSHSIPPATEAVNTVPPEVNEAAKQPETSEADIDWDFLNG